MPSEILPIESLRAERMKRVQIAQHVVVAVTLLLSAIDHPHVSVLSVLEIVVAIFMMATAARERIHRARDAHHGRVGWVEIAGGVMTFVEAVGKAQHKHHLLFYPFLFIPPIVLILFGIFDMKLAKMLYLKADDDALEVRTRLIRKRRVRWEGLRTYRITAKHVELTNEEGRTTRVKIKDIKHRDAAEAWLREQFEKRELREV